MARQGAPALALVVLLGGGCALVGGLQGDFEPIGDAGAGGAHLASCVDHMKDGAETDVDCGGGVCSQCADGQTCVKNADCASGYCLGAACTPSSCKDKIKNGTETGIDCGGKCSPCAPGQGCAIAGDCTSGVCEGGICQAPSCSDKVKNGAETSVDCGGGCTCAVGQTCMQDADCKSGSCATSMPDGVPMGVCQPATCADMLKDGSETDVDCGGTCLPCPTGKGCSVKGDCQSGVCTMNVCQAPTCHDGVKNGAEADVDCGEKCPGQPCADGEHCTVAKDCADGVCAMSVCQKASCTDGVLNEGETSVDCGGAMHCPCDPGLGCAQGTDCKSNICSVAGTCAAPSCTDKVRNGAETGIDCGGSCPPCPDGDHCLTSSDCASMSCVGGTCQTSTCMDGLQNEGETGVDCGGSTTCPRCAVGEGCTAGTDCASKVCLAGTCAPTCSDKVQDGAESGVDCGGPECPPCGVGQGCAQMIDCQSLRCAANVCAMATCSDGVKDGDEGDVDCGGSCMVLCANGMMCNVAADCASGGCTGGVGDRCGPWVRAFGPLAANSIPALAIEHDGTIVGAVTTVFPGIDFGGGTTSPPNGQVGRPTLFALSPTGQYAWASFMETTCDAVVSPLVSDGAGNLFSAGNPLGSPCDFGGGPVTAATRGLFVAQNAPSGSYVSAQLFGPGNVYVDRGELAVASNGDLVVGGAFDGATLTLGATTLTNPAPGTREGFVARLSSGSVAWAKAFDEDTGGVAVDKAGDVFVAGAYNASVDFGAPCAPLTGGYQGFVAKLSSTGACIWAQAAGITPVQGIGVDQNGDLVVAGITGNAVTLGGATVPGAAWTWTMKLRGSDGSSLWATSSTAPASTLRLVLDPAGNAVLAGYFASGNNPDFGGGALVSQGGNDVFVAAYASGDGHHLFSQGFGGPGDDEAIDLATSPKSGAVVVTGIFQNTVDFGTGAITAGSPYSMFVLSLGPLP